ncbi:hypothetical protein PPL_07913 [Heterostelium album PN500]|uniref:Uncharacterized protein n=1 Tax=Heterostelium pallidum (strain ATCC 26659 / Pp 5 / PN500) TaxID=670386 RepID=D3BHB1_HETP5|nr:hypothetical protein PPL_07913 [Heterostelium album PN500]EFA79088.1 hypothetical protein PPL_07913 [Heterostelium album PN500]|eukprot:XP_020431210.1 hypothetical protein PPL_07913 [Heterostelium album PN500]
MKAYSIYVEHSIKNEWSIDFMLCGHFMCSYHDLKDDSKCPNCEKEVITQQHLDVNVKRQKTDTPTAASTTSSPTLLLSPIGGTSSTTTTSKQLQLTPTTTTTTTTSTSTSSSSLSTSTVIIATPTTTTTTKSQEDKSLQDEKDLKPKNILQKRYCQIHHYKLRYINVTQQWNQESPTTDKFQFFTSERRQLCNKLDTTFKETIKAVNEVSTATGEIAKLKERNSHLHKFEIDKYYELVSVKIDRDDRSWFTMERFHIGSGKLVSGSTKRFQIRNSQGALEVMGPISIATNNNSIHILCDKEMRRCDLDFDEKKPHIKSLKFQNQENLNTLFDDCKLMVLDRELKHFFYSIIYADEESNNEDIADNNNDNNNNNNNDIDMNNNNNNNENDNNNYNDVDMNNNNNNNIFGNNSNNENDNADDKDDNDNSSDSSSTKDGDEDDDDDDSDNDSESDKDDNDHDMIKSELNEDKKQFNQSEQPKMLLVNVKEESDDSKDQTTPELKSISSPPLFGDNEKLESPKAINSLSPTTTAASSSLTTTSTAATTTTTTTTTDQQKITNSPSTPVLLTEPSITTTSSSSKKSYFIEQIIPSIPVGFSEGDAYCFYEKPQPSSTTSSASATTTSSSQATQSSNYDSVIDLDNEKHETTSKKRTRIN